MRRLRRIAFAIVPLVALLILAEAGLRIGFDTLPSLVGLGDSSNAPAFGERMSRCDAELSERPGAPDGSILVVGDSIATGQGVQQGEAFPAQLRQELGNPRVMALASGGADLCREMDALSGYLRRPDWPSVIVWEVFADDLAPYLVYSVGGRAVSLPSAEPNPYVRLVASHSYLGNELVLLYRVRTGGAADRHVDPRLHATLVEHLAGMAADLAAAGVKVVPFVLLPVGIDACAADAPKEVPCHWMPRDAGVLLDLLQRAGLEPVDLRGLWRGHADRCVEAECEAPTDGGVAIHPDAEGHRMLTEALLPAVRVAFGAPR